MHTPTTPGIGHNGGPPLPSLDEILRDQPLYLDELISAAEAARIIGTPLATVYTKRCRGGGMLFVKDGSRLKTTRRRCLEYNASLPQSKSTSDPGPRPVAA